MKRIMCLLMFISININILCTGCSLESSKSSNMQPDNVEIYTQTSKTEMNISTDQGKATDLPHYDSMDLGGWQVDIRSKDISSLKLKDRLSDLLYADFDTKTVWTKELPSGFNPSTIIESAKDPGLGIRSLHSTGITGKGINIAIVDSWMPDNHREYADNLKMYKTNDGYSPMKFHGSAVASIAIGKNTGVAPEANLYFISAGNSTNGKADFSEYAKAIEEIIETNSKLDSSNKIRVLSISAAWTPDTLGYAEVCKAIDKAIEDNIFVVSPNMFEYYPDMFFIGGVEIDSLQDRNRIENYHVVPWENWIYKANNSTRFGEYYEEKFDKVQPTMQLLIPIGCKSVASQTGTDEYTFFKTSGWSWAMPYIAGLYALCCQVKPDITPQEFWNVSLRTGEQRTIEKEGRKFIGKLVNPKKLITELKKAH